MKTMLQWLPINKFGTKAKMYRVIKPLKIKGQKLNEPAFSMQGSKSSASGRDELRLIQNPTSSKPFAGGLRGA
ncbi:hypothetical protein [Shewanella gelidii]|uniref:Uncharacterized protein n=1 Tax=Shewanella gelidii TaxID=1642821 RepID=A0A917NCL4_9GAMM|nr:hypothetical protein [Shewanella gelidii]MCL1098870.1 hypothetical protein [Shewanella gelidii]GGI89537.1 hypothetical protein GCM10009332_28670 [Shewanella gelidii]